MEDIVHIFKINIDWKLIILISQIDRFDASWTLIEKKEGQCLKQLKSIATVRSVGASTRIEGSKTSNEEVEVLLKKINITKIEDRDSQEVVGYFETLDLISELYSDIKINESGLKNLHNILFRHSQNDEWHKGDYKHQSNAVEAKLPGGTRQVIFNTAESGFQTEDAMRLLIDWYEDDNETHPLVKCALFVYDFVRIHPFQDGNGRLSRLISNLLLLKSQYKWVKYVSLEQEIESREAEYYRVLRNCQAQHPNENVTEWVKFFLSGLKNIQEQLIKELEFKGIDTKLSPREKSILTFVSNNNGCKSGEIAKRLGIPSPTVKRILPELIAKNLIERHGVGPGTNYSLK